MANQFLIKKTMADMKHLLASEIEALKQGTYEGVQLLGYYEAGDTPASIEYYLTNTGLDNKGDTITTGSIILKTSFEGKAIDALYYGLSSVVATNNNQEQLQHLFNSKAISINLPKGVTVEVSTTLEINTDNCVIQGNGFILKQKDNSGMLGTGNGGIPILQLKGHGIKLYNMTIDDNIDNNFVLENGYKIHACIPSTNPSGSSKYYGHSVIGVNGDDILIDGVTILGASWAGISIGPWGSSTKIKNPKVVNCRVEQTYRDSISVHSADNALIENNYVLNAAHHMIHNYRNCTGTRITNNKCIQNFEDLYIWHDNFDPSVGERAAIVVDHVSYADKTENTRVDNNYISSISPEGFRTGITSQGWPIGLIIYNNTILRCSNGIFLTNGLPRGVASVYSNTIRECIGGIRIASNFGGQVGGVTTPQVVNLNVVDNEIDAITDAIIFQGTQSQILNFYNKLNLNILANKIVGAPVNAFKQDFNFGSNTTTNKINVLFGEGQNKSTGLITTATPTKTEVNGSFNLKIEDYYSVNKDTIVWTQNMVPAQYYKIAEFKIRDGQRIAGEVKMFDNRMNVDTCRLHFMIKSANVISTLESSTPTTNKTLITSNIYWVRTPLDSNGLYTYMLFIKGVVKDSNIAATFSDLFISGSLADEDVKFIKSAAGIESLPTGTDFLTVNPAIRSFNQAAASSDTSVPPSATYSQAEVQEILVELRDLKTKLRSAGILAT
ncbi:right-handed parallel beta-helix repeat-containing protein [Sphingobacterium sp. N143]|uniref:right-handed parallel beta-helix repeat-containing protein n=1 Tax=Sphingobacterium sp. N143 TaxID=2746727 RepID=UPI002575BB66|nr:right-handed parallel beta-helix repeat-containing protein [Sphingobacterium sp. N143]MDM1295263.1 right-handed parallel beta-helix repeat-containing protein [Sphingobacterium sp. N143]